MKTKAMELEVRYVPFAFKARDEYQGRMMAGLGIGTALYAAVFAMYFLSPMILVPDAGFGKNEGFVIRPIDFPLHTLEENPNDGTGTGKTSQKDGGSGSGKGASRTDQAGIGTATMNTAIAGAMNTGIFGEGKGLPTAVADATAVGEGLADGVTVANAGGADMGARGTALAFGNDVGFNSGSNTGNSTIQTDSGDNTLGTDSGNRGMHRLESRATLSIRLNVRNARVSDESIRTADDISRIIRKSQAAVMDCYEKARASSGAENGKLIVTLLIRPDGGIATASVKQSSFKDEDFERNVLMRLRNLRFSQVSVNEMQQVEVPYEFGAI